MTHLHSNDDDKIIVRRARHYKITARKAGHETITQHYGIIEVTKRTELLVKLGYQYVVEIV